MQREVFGAVLIASITAAIVMRSILDDSQSSISLRQKSNIRPNRIFTADSGIILYRAGVITPTKMREVTAKITEILTT